MQAVITVVGSDKVGILAKISTICAEAGVNVEEVTQTILRDTFAMIMIVGLPDGGAKFSDISARLKAGGAELGVDVNVTRQDIYNSMHRI